MGRNPLWTRFLLSLALTTVSSFKIQNKLVGKCLQVGDGIWEGRVLLQDCTPDSTMQEWIWKSEDQALASLNTGKCLTAPEEQYEGVHLQPCTVNTGNEDNEDRDIQDREESNQAWSCSKKGHLTLVGRGLHLGASPQSTLVFLSREHKQGSRWRTLDNQTLCNWRDSKHLQHRDQIQDYTRESPQHGVFPSALSNIDKETKLSWLEDRLYPTDMDTFSVINGTLDSESTKSPTDPKMIFYTLDYGMAWKITMLVLTSLALVLGTVILILNVYSNRKKKVVCVLKSYAVRPEMSVPGSPVPSERAPLTEHAMRMPHSSPTMQRGEILIEWKDGTVTPLYEA